MPSWKKVIISGSAAELSSVFAPSITGSLQGTASFAVTASYALTSSFSLATSANQIIAINKSGFTITKGTVVHLTGSTNSSDTPYITTASYESDNLSANTLGIAAETITFNSTGYITTEGVLTGLNVTGFESGQVVYLGANGAIIGTAPQAPLHSVRLGQVVRDSPTNNGSIYVRIDNGYEIGELHDIIDNTATTSFGDLLVKSGSVWNTGKQLTGSYGLTGSLTIGINGPNGLIMDTDLVSTTNSARIFLKNSGSNQDISLRNNNHSLLIGYSASAGATSGPWITQISGSGVAIGNNYTVSAGRGAILQLSGSVNIEEGFAYKQDGNNILYITRGATGTAYDSIIGGVSALSGALNPDQTTAYGYYALARSNGTANTAVGYNAGENNTGSNQTLVGWNAGSDANGSNQTAVGRNAGYGNNGTFQAAYGFQAGYQNVGTNQTALGPNAGFQNTASNQTAVGESAGYRNSGSNQTAVGANAGDRNTATQQTAIGLQAGYFNVGVAQTALGQQAGQSNSGSNQTAVGYASGYQNSGSLQTAVGANAGRDNKGTNQTAVGFNAGRLNEGDDNTNIGYNAGYYTTGTTVNTGSIQSVFLGSSTFAGGGNRTNQIVIGYNASGIGSNSVVLGNSSITTTALRGNVGIGTTTPSASLHVTGSAIISDSLTVGSGSIGVTENTLTLGARDTINEGGQIGFNAPGGTYTSASMIDNYQNRFRILRGTNAGSDAEYFNLNLHSGQVTFNKYIGSGAFPGTVAGYLAFDALGNVLTTGGVTATPGGTTTQLQYNNAGALAGTSAITFDGTTLRATGSFTGSLEGTATSASLAATASYATIKTSGTTIYSADPAAGTTLDTDNSIFIGAQAGQNSGNGSFRSIGIGYQAGKNSSATAYGISIGYDAGSGITGNGSDVICIGRSSGKDTLTPQYSILIGNGAGQAFTGNQILYNNIIIGTNISLPDQRQDSINIGGIIFGTGSYSAAGGSTLITPAPGGRIGIGVVEPRATLDVSGSFHVEGTYKSPSGNTIDSNALIQAGLLYLSNNF